MSSDEEYAAWRERMRAKVRQLVDEEGLHYISGEHPDDGVRESQWMELATRVGWDRADRLRDELLSIDLEEPI